MLILLLSFSDKFTGVLGEIFFFIAISFSKFGKYILSHQKKTIPL
jgi:hypothetical protein